MELDGYNEDLKIAFEYNGVQHYKLDRFLNKTDNVKLNNTKIKDKLKLKICKSRGINLIVIPYTIQILNIKKYIENKLLKH
jgi:hypothetical protein